MTQLIGTTVEIDDERAKTVAYAFARAASGARNYETMSAAVLFLAWHCIKSSETPAEAEAIAAEWGEALVDNVRTNFTALKEQGLLSRGLQQESAAGSDGESARGEERGTRDREAGKS